MEVRARLNDVSFDTDGKQRLCFTLENRVDTSKLKGYIRLKAVRWVERRSLTANSYYWTLVERVADVMRLPKPEVHNLMLRRYGQVDRINGWVIPVQLPDTDEAERHALLAETYHIKPTSQVRMGDKGEMFRTYVMLKNSHELTTEEFSILLDGIIDDAKALGIETATPEEKERMLQLWTQYQKNTRA